MAQIWRRSTTKHSFVKKIINYICRNRDILYMKLFITKILKCKVIIYRSMEKTIKAANLQYLIGKIIIYFWNDFATSQILHSGVARVKNSHINSISFTFFFKIWNKMFYMWNILAVLRYLNLFKLHADIIWPINWLI